MRRGREPFLDSVPLTDVWCSENDVVVQVEVAAAVVEALDILLHEIDLQVVVELPVWSAAPRALEAIQTQPRVHHSHDGESVGPWMSENGAMNSSIGRGWDRMSWYMKESVTAAMLGCMR